jgi:ABC-type multidrug transport system ATPase subunit
LGGGRSADLRVENLKKVFRKNPIMDSPEDKVALKGISFSVRAGEVFAFLGHNGAGKTTTINLLCGMFPPTSGDAVVFGRSIINQMEDIRSSLGYCPQHDILYPELTVREHLLFYGRIKGLDSSSSSSSSSTLAQAVASTITRVGLQGKEECLTETLSGGMKRKLSLGIAYLGESKLVILDEPTAGMDPVSRRFIWDIIQQEKQGRVTLLTSHFMDEADILGDVVGIVCSGTMRCCGTSQFLKTRFNIGYRLSISFPPPSSLPSNPKPQALNPTPYIEAISKYVTGAFVSSCVGSELSFIIPTASASSICNTPHFPALLRGLEEEKHALGHESVG